MRRVGVTTQVSCLSAMCEEHACLLSVFKEKNKTKHGGQQNWRETWTFIGGNPMWATAAPRHLIGRE